MIYVLLFLQFFHIGLFSYGGGYATLPFLYHIAEHLKWYSPEQLSDMIAVSAITPGPVGVNVSTFAGYTVAGIFGALIATTAVVLPSYIIVVMVSEFLSKYKNNSDVKAAIYALKPACCGMLAAVAMSMFANKTNFVGVLFLALMFYISIKQKRDPLFYLGTAAIFGVIAGFLKLTV